MAFIILSSDAYSLTKSPEDSGYEIAFKTGPTVKSPASGKDGRLHAKKSPENGAWNWDPIYRHQPSSLASKHAHGHNHIICAAAGWAAVSACKPPCRISFYILVSLVQESTSSPRVDQQSYWCHLLFGVVAPISRHTYVTNKHPHQKLLYRFEVVDVSDPLLNWLRSCPSERSQRTVFGEFASDWRGVPSGAPQMSIVGPLLFPIFINDIADNISIAITKNPPLRRWC
ncbi:hypothetical protein P5673_019444 [Acropora cervicornis]|uniref:Uncharacterized protein n=1 Tax=Acropora cervicornis TaxID=6130 RepID=A0AAD9V240_ACRCE|nr:hypothetical protein P5673_019444 [Acropora cervicornis]